jgi:hypothetical protein
MPKILHLTLKRKWFDMIASGKKLEEYREVKKYWIERFTWHEYHKADTLKLIHTLANGDAIRKDFDQVEFKNGYSKDAPTITLELKGIRYGQPNLKWIGADDKPDNWYFCLQLGKIISQSNQNKHS